jgi:hypothetical protein
MIALPLAPAEPNTEAKAGRPLAQLFRAARQIMAKLAGDDPQPPAGKKRSGEASSGGFVIKTVKKLAGPIIEAFRLAKEIAIPEPFDPFDPLDPLNPTAPLIEEQPGWNFEEDNGPLPAGPALDL